MLICFAQQYIIPQFYYFAHGEILNRYHRVTEEDYFAMLVCCSVFIVGLLMGQLCVRTKNFSQCYEFFIAESGFNLRLIKKILIAISLVAIILQFQTFISLFHGNDLSNRLVINQGSGYLQFFNVSSYFIVFIGIKQYLSGRMSLQLLILHALPAFIIYSLKLQRGHALYPLFIILLAYLYTHLKAHKASWIVACLAILMLYIGNLTSTIRSSVINSPGQVELLHSKQNPIPASYAHTELLCAIIADHSTQYLPSTLWGALVNWVPRSLYPNKPKTLGPTLNNHFSPDTSFYRLNGIHRSSYTTDPIIEGFYHAGYLGVLFFAFLYSYGSSWLWNSITQHENRETFFMSFPLALYIVGFTAYFSDMGNWIGYIVIYYGVFWSISLLTKIKV